MKEIILANGEVAFVDDEFYEELTKYRWRFNNKRGYATRTKHTIKSETGWKTTNILMHQEVVRLSGRIVPPDMEIDHFDRNKLNNQNSNLIIATRSHNMHNTGLRSTNTSGVKGVGYCNYYGKYQARIEVNGYKRSRYFHTFEQAVAARREWEIQYGVAHLCRSD